MPRIRSVNLSEADLSLLSSFLSSSYQKLSGAPVTAHVEGATEVIETLAYGLGPGASLPILIRAQRRSELGVVLAQAELQIETLAQTPAVFDRLAQALLCMAPRIDSPAAPDTHNIFGVKLWFGAALAVDHTFNALGAVMFDARLEKETYFFELGVGVVIPGPSGSAQSSGYGGFVAELGASKYLNGGNTAFYAGGGVLPRLLFSTGALDSPLNLAPYGQLGLMLDRSSSTRLYADVRIAQNVLPIRVSGPSQSAYPTELSGQIGIGW